MYSAGLGERAVDVVGRWLLRASRAALAEQVENGVAPHVVAVLEHFLGSCQSSVGNMGNLNRLGNWEN